MKFKEIPNSQNNPEKAEQRWMIQTPVSKLITKLIVITSMCYLQIDRYTDQRNRV